MRCSWQCSPHWHAGTPGDYNQWEAPGNKGWGYDDLEPYFVKSEKTHSHSASKYRGTKGGSESVCHIIAALTREIFTGVWHNRNFVDSPYKIVD